MKPPPRACLPGGLFFPVWVNPCGSIGLKALLNGLPCANFGVEYLLWVVNTVSLQTAAKSGSVRLYDLS